ncbi:lipopolysaccharide transport periplasmic protein LptA [Aliarcobacter vitoriensis]|uniref:lipopolysaccharide transport periplasmic protein LptA n=1 Tax=Aliarcobacter vitoriensis TaxID=2011099 RepID=UPI000DEB690A|nr:lipopolysaccharide transport periplasmic protein LptA [Arcobacter sp. FW59]
MRILAGLFICSILLFAQSETLVIDALDFKADDNKGISTFTGNVKVRMGEDKLNANRVDVFFENEKNSKNKIATKYEATGNADFEVISNDKHYVGKGDKIVYSPIKEEYTIIGNGFVHEKNDDRKVYGDNIYINQLTGEAKVKGSENKPVKFIINVERGEKN